MISLCLQLKFRKKTEIYSCLCLWVWKAPTQTVSICKNTHVTRALAFSIRTLSIYTGRTTNSWVRCTGETGENSRFNRTDPHQAASTHLWSRFANTPDIVWTAAECVQRTAARTSSENDDGADGSLKRLQAGVFDVLHKLVWKHFRCKALRHQN